MYQVKRESLFIVSLQKDASFLGYDVIRHILSYTKCLTKLFKYREVSKLWDEVVGDIYRNWECDEMCTHSESLVVKFEDLDKEKVVYKWGSLYYKVNKGCAKKLLVQTGWRVSNQGTYRLSHDTQTSGYTICLIGRNRKNFHETFYPCIEQFGLALMSSAVLQLCQYTQVYCDGKKDNLIITTPFQARYILLPKVIDDKVTMYVIQIDMSYEYIAGLPEKYAFKN